MNAVLYSLFPVAAALVAAACAVFFQKSDRIRCLMQHLAARVVVAAVAVELIPELLHRHSPVPTALGFSLAVVVLIGAVFAVMSLAAMPPQAGFVSE